MKTAFAKLGLGLALGGAALLSSAQAADASRVLTIYNRSNYIAEDTIRNFEKETGIRVRYDTYDADDTLDAKLLAGNTGYDVVVTGAHFAKTQIEGGLLQKLDKSKLGNWGNLNKNVLERMAMVDPGNQYLVNWLWGYVTLGIHVDKVKAALGDTPMPENVWSLLFDPHYAAKLKKCGISVPDSASEVVPAALLYTGKHPFSKDAADYEAAARLLKSIRPFVSRFSTTGSIDDMVRGSSCLVMGFAGDINIAASRAAAAKGKKPFLIQALVPKIGANLFFDSMAIPRDAKNVENAHLFINYILRPEVHASLTNELFYANPNAASLKFVKKEVADNKSIFLEPAAMKAMVAPDALPQDIRNLQARTFTSFKTGK
jgi:putrescine transport system substrate-binding protein